MKKGKSCEIKGFKKIKCKYGTVDSKNLKSFYLNIQSWVEPKNEETNWDRIISILIRNIKNTVNEILNLDFLDNKIIVDLDLRSSGISLGKKSFMNLEITFFIKKQIDFKSPIIKEFVKKTIDVINQDIFKYNNYFNFYLTKTSKLTNTKKMENI
jgi:hypothetical protein